MTMTEAIKAVQKDGETMTQTTHRLQNDGETMTEAVHEAQKPKAKPLKQRKKAKK